MVVAFVVITTSGRDSAATKTVSIADAVLDEKGKKKEIHELQNDKHSTCHYE